MPRPLTSVLTAAALALVLASAGCASKTIPAEEPYIEGLVTSVGTSGALPVFLVETDEPPSSSYMNKANVTTDADTTFFDGAGDPLDDGSGIETGIRVRVWIDGPIAESFPVQGTASAVQLLE